MRILLDESLPRPLRDELTGHSVKTVAEMGWSAVENGELLRRAAGQFDVVLTADQNVQFQQNLDALPLAVVVLAARTNRLEDLKPLMPELLVRLQTLIGKPLLRIGAPS
jgi:predicted nuclease of predicted toxin-antitoxin system